MDFIKIQFGTCQEDFESKFEKTFGNMIRSINPMIWHPELAWKPQMDIYETQTEIIILAEIAGVNKDELGIEINNKAVRIHGCRQEIPRSENSTFRLAEIQFGRFERILYLPDLIDTDKVKASYTDGFLSIRLGKIKQSATQKIKISDSP